MSLCLLFSYNLCAQGEDSCHLCPYFLFPHYHAIPRLLRLNADLGTQQLYPKKGEQRGLDRGREGGLVGGKKEGHV